MKYGIYCRGTILRAPARSHVQFLKEEEFAATHLPVGVAEWKAAGAVLTSTKGGMTL
ncbi:MAG: hypothetical protein ACLFSE_09760 [Spirochaetia bacterium]